MNVKFDFVQQYSIHKFILTAVQLVLAAHKNKIAAVIIWLQYADINRNLNLTWFYTLQSITQYLINLNWHHKHSSSYAQILKSDSSI